MVRAFCASGQHEFVKCGVHGAAGVILALCAVYNITACCFRRDRHLRINAVVYTLAVGWEIKQTLHHLSAFDKTPVCLPTGGSQTPVDRVPEDNVA
jgi:hypothetical protein